MDHTQLNSEQSAYNMLCSVQICTWSPLFHEDSTYRNIIIRLFEVSTSKSRKYMFKTILHKKVKPIFRTIKIK